MRWRKLKKEQIGKGQNQTSTNEFLLTSPITHKMYSYLLSITSKNIGFPASEKKKKIILLYFLRQWVVVLNLVQSVLIIHHPSNCVNFKS